MADHTIRINGTTYNIDINSGTTVTTQNLYDVTAYGLLGDDSTDNTSAFTTMLATVVAAGGSRFYFPSGTYQGEFEVGDVAVPLTFYGDGAMSILKAPDDTTIDILSIRSDDVLVQDLCFDGNISGQTVWTQSDHCIAIYGKRVTVENCRFKNIEGDGVYVARFGGDVNPEDVTVTGCSFFGTHENRNGVSVVGGDRITIEGNHFYKMTKVGMPAAIDIEPNTSESVSNVKIIGNSVEGSFFDDGGTDTPYAIGISTSSGASGSSIDGLVIDGNVLTGWFTDAIYGGGSSTTGGVISNNSISGSSGVADQAAIQIINDSSWLIDSNTIITDNATAARRYHHGIRINACDNTVDIRGNKIEGCYNYGIRGNHSGTDALRMNITDNTLFDCGSSGTGTDGGVRLGSSYGMCCDNHFGATSAMGCGVRFTTDTGAGNNVVEGNHFDGNVTSKTSGAPAASDRVSIYTAYSSAATQTDDDTTPSVNGVSVLVTIDNTSPTAITQLDNAVAGQVITIIGAGGTNPATIADSGNFNLSAAWSGGADDALTLVTPDGSTWYETGRSTN